MAEAISALDRTPEGLIRVVSPEALDFFTDELSGLYMPEDFARQNAHAYDVERWDPKDRLDAKFGHFVIQGEDGSPVDQFILMGSIVGVNRLNDKGHLEAVRHYQLNDAAIEIARQSTELRQLLALDYGVTKLTPNISSRPLLEVGGSSIDYDRANTEGRVQTCELFEAVLGEAVEVINVSPEHDVEPYSRTILSS